MDKKLTGEKRNAFDTPMATVEARMNDRGCIDFRKSVGAFSVSSFAVRAITVASRKAKHLIDHCQWRLVRDIRLSRGIVEQRGFV